MDYRQKKVVIRLLKRIVKQIHLNQLVTDTSNYVFLSQLQDILLEKELFLNQVISNYEDREFWSPDSFIVPELTIHGAFTPDSGCTDNTIVVMERTYIGNRDDILYYLNDLRLKGADSSIIRILGRRDDSCLLDESILTIVFSFAVLALYCQDEKCRVNRLSKVNNVGVIEGTVILRSFDKAKILSDCDWCLHHFRLIEGKVRIMNSTGNANSISSQRDEILRNRESVINVIER